MIFTLNKNIGLVRTQIEDKATERKKPKTKLLADHDYLERNRKKVIMSVIKYAAYNSTLNFGALGSGKAKTWKFSFSFVRLLLVESEAL